MKLSQPQAEEVIRRIMSGDEFNRDPGETVDTAWLQEILKKIMEFLRKIMEKINEWFARLFSRLNFKFPEDGEGEGMKTAAKVIIIVLIVAATAAIVIAIVKVLSKRKRVKNGKDTSEELLEFSDQPDAAFELYEQYRSRGNLRFAFRYLFINLLSELNRKEVIHIAKYKTNRSYIKEIRSSAEADMELVMPFFQTFDRVWYGNKPISEKELDSFIAYRSAILNGAGSSTPKGSQGGTTGGNNAGRAGDPDEK